MNKNFRTVTIYLVLLGGLVWFVMSQIGAQPAGPVELSTNKFIAAAEDGRVESVKYVLRNGGLSGQYWKSEEAKEKKQKSVAFTSTWAGDDSFTEFAKSEKVPFEIDNSGPSPWLSLLETLLPLVLIGVFLMFLFNQMQGGNSKVMNFGKAKVKRMARDQPRITFKDVAGADEAIEELEEIKDFLAEPGKFQALGAKIPKGVLLVGPPGTGKTLLARAVAGEAAVPFFSISGSDFVEMFVGVGASRVRDLFEQAKAASPCIIFMDEIDAVGRQRGAGLGGGHDEREQTLNQLLVEMDGFDMKDNVILIAATNRPDILDPALLRPGRFDRQVVVDRPDLKGRLGILKIHSRGKPLTDDIDLEVLARRTPGFTGADLANLVNEAALLAARHGKKSIDMDEMEEGIDRVVAGPERKSRLLSEEEKRITAFHEAGHAIVGHLLPKTDPIHKVTIIPRGRALGITMSLPTEDKFTASRSEMLDDIAMLLGGRVAEEIVLGDITTGAANDIERATKTAKQMVTRFGMSDRLGPQTFGDANHEVFLGRDFSANADYSQEIAFEIDKEVARIIGEAYERARSILTERRDRLDLMAGLLIERETLERDELTALLDGNWEEFEAAREAAEESAAQERPEEATGDDAAVEEPSAEGSSAEGAGDDGEAGGSGDAQAER